MAALQDRLAALLLTDNEILTLTNSSVDWDVAEQGITSPHIVMFLVAESRDYTFDGEASLRDARVQFDCRAPTSVESRRLAAALDELLSGYRGEFGGVNFRGCFKEGHRTRFDMDGNTRWFQAQIDYRIWWAPAA